MTTDKRVEFQVRLSDAETEAATGSIANTDRIANLVEREIYVITSNKQIHFKKELSICLIEFEVWWNAIRVQEFRKTIEHRVINFGYPEMHFASHISESIRQMSSGNNSTTDISDRLHIGNVKRQINVQIKSITLDRCSSTMTSVPVSTIWRRHCPILLCKGGTILTGQKFSTYHMLPLNGEILAEPMFKTSRIVRKGYFSAPCHDRYIILQKPMSAACAEVSN